MSKLLIIDDDISLAHTLKDAIESNEWNVEIAHNGSDANQLLDNFNYDMILLDWHLPDITGIELCKAVRQKGNITPIIFVTGNDEANSLENALDIGADDYLTKPFKLSELLARIRTVHRRASGLATSEIKAGGAKLDKKSRKLIFANAETDITAIESELIEYLMRHPNQTFSSADLFKAVWASDSESGEDTVRVHIRSLRRKLGLINHTEFVKTILGKGYIVDSK